MAKKSDPAWSLPCPAGHGAVLGQQDGTRTGMSQPRGTGGTCLFCSQTTQSVVAHRQKPSFPFLAVPTCPKERQQLPGSGECFKMCWKTQKKSLKQLHPTPHSKEMSSLEKNVQRRAPPSCSHCGSNSENSSWNWV